MPTRCRSLFAAVIAVFLATPLILPAAASAQTAGAYLDGAEPWTESDCAGAVPVVVGADAKAQSDIYSAVTLAGVLGTDCVILAGPRDGDMTAAQRARLEAADAGGYVVGGTAAVPEAKLAGRDMTRLGGATRWATAQLVGSEARAIAGGTEADSAGTPDTTLTAPNDVAQPGVFLDGAEPWIASDCAGDVPIVVGSDANAQSDIYSAVTLAGVVGTDCVILAGPRSGTVPASQRARLDAAEAGGFVLGGVGAVSTAKIAGRDMTRLGGASRWETAQLVGRRAAGDTTAGSSTATETTQQTGTVPAIIRGPGGPGGVVCGLHNDGNAKCIVVFEGAVDRDIDIPAGPYADIAPGVPLSCGLRTDDTVTCWEATVEWTDRVRGVTTSTHPAPQGTFASIHQTGGQVVCGLGTDSAVTCWGNPDSPLVANLPTGAFASIHQMGWGSLCGLRTDGAIACWGNPDSPVVANDPPAGAFASIHQTTGWDSLCGLRTDGAIACWGNPDNPVVANDPPTGAFASIHQTGWDSLCGLRTDGAIACWGNPDLLVVANDPPAGAFASIHQTGWDSLCGLRTDGAIACWGNPDDPVVANDPPAGSFVSLGWANAYGGGACGLRTDGTIACWGHEHGPGGEPRFNRSDAVSAPFAVWEGLRFLPCALDTRGGFDCDDRRDGFG